VDSKLFMRYIARNRTVKYLFIVFYCVLSPLFAEKVKLPEFSSFNRSINQGSEISYAVKYKGRPTDKLSVGVKSPEEDGWESHSIFTTGLFLIHKNRVSNITFMLRSDGDTSIRSKLLINLRYFDKNGIHVESGGWNVSDAPYEWKRIIVPVAPKNNNVSYAEAWFIKYQDADSSGEVNHPVYVSAVSIQ